MSSSNHTTRETARTGSTSGEFESVYRSNVAAITGFFARRAEDPQTVADLTSETFVRAVKSSSAYDGRGSPRAWLFAIARAVYADHHESLSIHHRTVGRLGGLAPLVQDELDDVVDRVDAERAARSLLTSIVKLPQLERAALELVDLVGMTPAEAAQSLGVAAGTLRVRLFRARSRLRKETET